MKMYLFNFILWLVIIFGTDGHPQANPSQTGDIQIITQNGNFICDSMECPKESIKCRTSRVTTPDLKQIKRSRVCFGPNDVSLKNEEVFEPNPQPGVQVSDYAEVMRSGISVFQCQNCGNLGDIKDVEGFNKELAKKIQEQTEASQRFFAEMSQRMADLFKNIFGSWN